MSASLTLVPTPIAESLPLEPTALALLHEECLKPEVVILVEEHKIARIRWLAWGLPREAIEKFELLNEHTQDDKSLELVRGMRAGKRYYLLSDAGLPAFCDPGQKLVDACHEAGFRVTSTPFPNSIALALALSGFSHQRFLFAGFLPANGEERKLELEKLSRTPDTMIIMDTPYRLVALFKDLAASNLKKRKCFLAMNLNAENEQLERGSISGLAARAIAFGKREFILILAADK
jgi:16S rRNA (cytidine1402-2'-O)-methyltransferase